MKTNDKGPTHADDGEVETYGTSDDAGDEGAICLLDVAISELAERRQGKDIAGQNEEDDHSGISSRQEEPYKRKLEEVVVSIRAPAINDVVRGTEVPTDVVVEVD